MPILRAIRSPLRRTVSWNTVAAAWMATFAVGCGGNPAPPAPATAPVARAPQENSASDGSAGGTATAAGAAPARPAIANALSGDTEPMGRDATFTILDDPSQGGSHWVIDGRPLAASADHFAFVPSTAHADSTRFLMPPAGSQRPIAADDDDVPPPSKAAPARGSDVLPEGFAPLSGTALSSEGYPLRIRCRQDGAVMAFVEGGLFIQGKSGAGKAFEPEHAVVLDPFYIDVREVTYEKYAKYREAARELKRRVAEPAATASSPRAPVTGIAWGEARAYALWAGKELPTEAQWEKAARGPDGFDFPWGNGTYVWHRPRTPGQIDPVGVFRGDTSPYGVVDLAGNAREWCSDWYQEGYALQLGAESGGTARNPTGPRASGGTNQRVVKGGAPGWHAWWRTGIIQSERPADVGFRCVLRVKPAPVE